MIGWIEKIAFVRDALTSDGAGGNTVTKSTIWEPQGAKVFDLRMNNETIATQEGLSAVLEVHCRYNPEIPILSSDRIEWRGFAFTKLRPIVDFRKRTMKITAVAEIETTNREEP